MSRARRFPPTLTGWLLGGAVLLAALLSLLAPLNQSLWDALNRALPTPADARVVVVGIDDAALRDYGRVDTWDRRLYARALQTLQQAGARAVALDVLLQGSAPGDDALTPLLGDRVVLATAPDDPQGLSILSGTLPRRGPGSRTGLAVLNIDPDGVVRHFQRHYRVDGVLTPSLAEALVARAAGQRGGDGERTETLRVLEHAPSGLRVLPFAEVVSGNVRYADLQDKLVLIGVTASGGGDSVMDVTRRPVPGVLLQARAVSSLLSPPFRALPLWAVLLTGILAAAAAVLLRGFWGFFIALGAVGVSLPLWLADVQFPGATVSVCAMMGLLLVAAERWWQLRQLGTLDPLTGLGNRLAFTRAVEHRWAGRLERPIGLLLVELPGLHRAGPTQLQRLLSTLRGSKRRHDVVFRWGPDEFVVLLDGVGAQELARLSGTLHTALTEGGGEGPGPEQPGMGAAAQASVGYALTGPEVRTPTELIERASRMRYRNKYRSE